jgi:hypothetical protein
MVFIDNAALDSGFNETAELHSDGRVQAAVHDAKASGAQVSGRAAMARRDDAGPGSGVT